MSSESRFHQSVESQAAASSACCEFFGSFFLSSSLFLFYPIYHALHKRFWRNNSTASFVHCTNTGILVVSADQRGQTLGVSAGADTSRCHVRNMHFGLSKNFPFSNSSSTLLHNGTCNIVSWWSKLVQALTNLKLSTANVVADSRSEPLPRIQHTSNQAQAVEGDAKRTSEHVQVCTTKTATKQHRVRRRICNFSTEDRESDPTSITTIFANGAPTPSASCVPTPHFF